MPTPSVAVQATFDELGTPLREVTFVVVDLETTGGSAAQLRDHRDRRGEGARRRGARRVPDAGQSRRADPAVHRGAHRHHQLDGRRGAADRARAAGVPRVRRAGSVLVAHNAPFDVGFLKAACAATGHAWPASEVLDTARLARRVVTRDEAPNCKLASLARLFRAATTPNHRALSDARATVDVLHGLIERLGGLGVHTARGAADLLRAGLPRPARASGTWPRASRTRPASTCSATSTAGCSTSARARTCAPGSAPTSRPPRPARRMGEMVGLAERSSRASSARPPSRPRCASCG